LNFEKELSRVCDLVGEGSWSQARVMAERALAVFPDQAQLWFVLGASLYALGVRLGAIKAFRKTIELARAFVPALNAMATALNEEGRPARALDLLDRAVALAPSDAFTLFNRGIVLERLARFQESIAAYDAVIAADELFAPAWLNRGAVLMVIGQYETAVDNNRRLIGFQPDSADAHFNLAEALLGLGRRREALAACDRAIELDPRYAQAHLDRGLALSDLGRFEDAQRAFDTADTVSPEAMRKCVDAVAPADPSLTRAFDPLLVFFYRGYRRPVLCDWSMRDLYIERIRDRVMGTGEDAIARIDLPLAYHSLTVPFPPDVPHRIACVIGDRYAAAVAETGRPFPTDAAGTASASVICPRIFASI
jgi:tetratricopeptide (TPR) repeat protein